ncbi:hypothetical protein JNUCC64_12165 [Streptomyces sp. JNUCC 64]
MAVRTLGVRPDGEGLGYRDETASDRDARHVLWSRVTQAPGRGRPDFGSVHPLRQRDAMTRFACQVCGGEASRTAKGWLFLLPAATGSCGPEWPEGVLHTKPPLCLPCAGTALKYCPHLREPIAVRARKARPSGVLGAFYVQGNADGTLSSSRDCYLPHGHPRSRWFLASQQVAELRRCTRVDLRTELSRPARGA